MKVLNPRSALLSKFEALSHFTSMHQDNARVVEATSQARTRQRAINDGDTDTLDRLPLRTPNQVKVDQELVLRGMTEDILFVTEQVCKHLNAEYSSTSRQSAQGLHKLSKALQVYGLTKAEILQIVDLLPTKLVELYVIVEECDTRLSPDQMDQLLQLVSSTLSAAPEQAVHEEQADGEDYQEYEAYDDEAEWDEEMVAAQEQGGEFVTERAWGGEGGIEDEGDGEIDG